MLIVFLALHPDWAAARERSPAAQRLLSLVEDVRDDYPQVPHISVAQLKANFEQFLLLDVREREEFEVSHLPGALHAQAPEAIDTIARAHPDKTLVFYCTVGVRSAIATQDFLARRKLTAETKAEKPDVSGAKAAFNLAGSIFAWANQGERLENADGVTRDVHPYSAWWGLRYLDDQRPPSKRLSGSRGLDNPE